MTSEPTEMESLDMPAHLPCFSVQISHSRDCWRGWKSVHAGVHEICVNPEFFLSSVLMMTRPDLVG